MHARACTRAASARQSVLLQAIGTSATDYDTAPKPSAWGCVLTHQLCGGPALCANSSSTAALQVFDGVTGLVTKPMDRIREEGLATGLVHGVAQAHTTRARAHRRERESMRAR